VPSPFGDEPEDVRDPEGHWLPDGVDAERLAESLSIDSVLFRNQGRWAPQHGARGRSDTALPGAFLFPEPDTELPPRTTEPAEEAAEEPRKGYGGHTLIREIVETGLLAILVFLAVRASVQHYRVEGHSMDPTLDDGEFLLVNSLVYSKVDLNAFGEWVPFWDPAEPDERFVFHGPERGDIIVLHHRVQVENRDLVKRVIGLPGDTVEVRDGVVIINGRILEEPYITEPWGGNFDAKVMPPGQYFVMGDNRNNSLDSRIFGPVLIEDIVGKALVSWWPRDAIGLSPNEKPKLGDPAR